VCSNLPRRETPRAAALLSQFLVNARDDTKFLEKKQKNKAGASAAEQNFGRAVR